MTRGPHTPEAPEDTADTQPMPLSSFEIAPTLVGGADTGSVRLGTFDRLYEALFTEAIEGGGISTGERERLDLAAGALGLDASRVAQLEAALVAAWESQGAETLVDPHKRERSAGSERAPSPGLTTEGLHASFAAAGTRGAVDDQWRIADVLVHRGAALREPLAFWQTHRLASPVRPRRPLTALAWSSLLMHPDEDRTIGEVFGVIASAALIGRVSAMRRDGALPKIHPDAFQNPLTSSVGAVRAMAWSAAALGIRMPPTYIAPEVDAGLAITTMVPPCTRIGARTLSCVSPGQLAFACGHHLTWYREEHFICTLVPSVEHLEPIFEGAVLLGTPGLPLSDAARQRAEVFAQAIAPCLEPAQIDRLRHLGARWLTGERPNLRRWARAAEATACRAGLLLCGELAHAVTTLAAEPGGDREARIAQLETFWTSEQAGELRRQLGVALT